MLGTPKAEAEAEVLTFCEGVALKYLGKPVLARAYQFWPREWDAYLKAKGETWAAPSVDSQKLDPEAGQDWPCPHDPHCLSRFACQQRSTLEAAKAAPPAPPWLTWPCRCGVEHGSWDASKVGVCLTEVSQEAAAQLEAGLPPRLQEVWARVRAKGMPN